MNGLKKDIFPCKICNVTFYCESNYRSHKVIHLRQCGVVLTRTKIYECKKCHQAFLCHRDSQLHKAEHVAKEVKLRQCGVVLTRTKIYECKKCHQAFLLHRDFQLHKAEHVAKEVKESLKKIKCTKIYQDIGEYIKPYKCNECDAKFVQESNLEAHSAVHVPFPCICVCGIGYYKRKDLISHMNLVKCDGKIEKDTEDNKSLRNGYSSESDDEEVFINNVDRASTSEIEESASADDEYKPKKSKNGKRKSKVVNVLKARTCKYCSTTCSSFKQLISHTKSHFELPHGCSRPNCLERFSTPKQLEEHLDLIHSWKCKICQKNLASKNGLKIHMRTHTGERPYSCKICGKSFNQSSALGCHLNVHAGVRNFKCDCCDKAFMRKASLHLHERTHTGEKPYMCKFCNKAFGDPSALGRHVRIHTGDFRYECDLCQKKFTDVSGLVGHKMRHNKKTKKCDMCNKSFYSIDGLRKHEILHIGEKKYECDYCHVKFLHKSYLFSHINRIHTNPFCCDHCTMTFTSKQRIRRHIVKNHSVLLHCNVCYKKFYNELDFYSHKSKKCYKKR